MSPLITSEKGKKNKGKYESQVTEQGFKLKCAFYFIFNLISIWNILQATQQLFKWAIKSFKHLNNDISLTLRGNMMYDMVHVVTPKTWYCLGP